MNIAIDYSTQTSTADLPGGFTLHMKFMQEEGISPPWEEWDGEGSVVVIHRGPGVYEDRRFIPLDQYLGREYKGQPRDVYRSLASGSMVKNREGFQTLGIEAYIHSGERWYLPGGCQIDRQWDVAPVKAIWIADKEVLANLQLKRADRRHYKKLRDYLSSCLTSFNMYLSGDVWYYSEARVLDPDGEVVIDDVQDACIGGLYGEDSLREYANEAAETAVSELMERGLLPSQKAS